ncbi:DNA-binding transcriptional ArsR family regulator [Isoptericola sp. CG 20/1183]|uniref:DNA-binding transcriptional ArsR family regulator n=1 Tax=Isoptericola halotolerans TaxID=300560 RepID=A0ABX5EC82_9MICO|nr:MULTISPECIES: metalloregulator ArsR/SmtB family transcription factor [Isoptericola]PRZ05184.1 DNA-binding transcriptional ArsR family regulator [Isoptericola halotolerans]PRZ05922.1 DNA-binding transcriptional ArsR family regulator [Isoptericola sp. CG 20/1183]
MTDHPSPSNLAVLSALAEPNRLAIVSLLREGPRAVGDIAARIEIAQPHASRHLRILADAGLVSARREAQSRIYRLERSPFASLENWLDTFSAVWEERADRLGDYLEHLDEDSSDTRRQEGTS